MCGVFIVVVSIRLCSNVYMIKSNVQPETLAQLLEIEKSLKISAAPDITPDHIHGTLIGLSKELASRTFMAI